MLYEVITTTSCSKKVVKEDTSLSQQAEDEAAKAAAEKARQEELARQRAIEEAGLKEEAIQKAKDNFLNEDVPFEFDSAVLTPDAQEILKTKAEWLQNSPNVKSTIEGHCDERGTLEYNLALGERRASSRITSYNVCYTKLCRAGSFKCTDQPGGHAGQSGGPDGLGRS